MPDSTPIDAYLQALPDERRALLTTLRDRIRAVVPDAEECISYGMPAFRLPLGVVAGFQATKDGGSYYPHSGSTLRALADDLTGFGGTPGALHFTANKPLSLTLVRKLIKTRTLELEAKGAQGRRAATSGAPRDEGPGRRPTRSRRPRRARRSAKS